MSIAVDRVQNYYQFQDAESKFYQVCTELGNDYFRQESVVCLEVIVDICVICFCVFLMQAA